MKKSELEDLLSDGGLVPDTGPMEVHLHALATERRLPAVALFMCVARIEESAPALCAVLARAADGEPLSDDEDRLAFRGLHVLGGARYRQAWPDFVRLLRRPQDELEALLGDAITENLGQIAVGLFDGEAESLFDLIADRDIEEYVRESLFKAATFLTWEARIEKDRMREFLRWFYEDRRAADEDYCWVGWLEAIAYLGLRDLAPLVAAAWDDGRVPLDVMERRDFETDLAEAESAPDDIERLSRARMGYIDDVLVALEWTDYDEPDDLSPDADPTWDPFPLAPVETVVNPMRHVGRNDPCPCGSGKKAKKCCLAA